jgi:hypothetical protein
MWSLRIMRGITEIDCVGREVSGRFRGMHDYADPDEPTYAELVEGARALLAAGDMSGAFSQAWQACLIEPLDPVSSRLMEQAAKQAEPGLATIARAVLAARQDAISLLVPGQRLSSTATLLPESGQAGDMAAWVESWKEAIRLARKRDGN